MQNLS